MRKTGPEKVSDNKYGTNGYYILDSDVSPDRNMVIDRQTQTLPC